MLERDKTVSFDINPETFFLDGFDDERHRLGKQDLKPASKGVGLSKVGEAAKLFSV